MSERITEGHDGPGILVNLEPASRATVVAFGGLTTDGEVPKFEFFRFLSTFGARYVLLRDHEQAWYHLGARDVADTIDGVGEHLASLLSPDELRHAVFTGGSMGGFVALLLGSRLQVGEVQAFAPQTFISRVLRRYHKDFRWQKQVNKTWASVGTRRTYYDIKGALRRTQRRHAVPLHIHVGTMATDQRHVQRIARIPGVHVHTYDEVADHNIAGALVDTDRLRPLFEASIARVNAGA
ncbi:MAG TPA: hypothetical protein VH914_03355 [Acidimicrobiia bacterium]|nr:hypothetical protein [Acidimicrobiia bacterium]